MNRKLLMFVTMTTHFLNPFMGAAVNVGLKQIGNDFGLTAVELSWVNMSYLLASAVFLIPFGKISDLYGRGKTFLFGNIFFALFSFVSAFSFNGLSLIIFRALQGIASSMQMATVMAIVISAFPPNERGKSIGLNVTSVYIGSSLAPVFGGFITDILHWRAIFLIPAIISTIIALVAYHLFKNEKSIDVTSKFDYTTSLLYVLSISLLMYGFSKLPLLHSIILTIIGIVGVIVFVFKEKTSSNPILDLKLFSNNRTFTFSNITALINYSATFAVSFMLSLYLQYVKGFQARFAGIILIAQPITMAVVASFSGRLSDRRNPKVLASAGMAISSFGLLILSLINYFYSLEYVLFGLFILGIGFGLFSSPNTNVVMGSVSKQDYGIASAMLATMRTTGMVLSMAIASLIIHILVGDEKINPSNIKEFSLSTQIVLSVFTFLCFLGVFFSLIKDNNH